MIPGKPYIDSETLRVEVSTISIDTAQILKSLQVPADKADMYLLDLIELYKGISQELNSPCASYTVYENPEFSADRASLQLNGNTFSLGKIVMHALLKSTRIAFFVCTCGGEVEKLSKQLISDGQTLEGFIVDLIGSEIAEGTADLIHSHIGEVMKKSGLNITNRYSPGYCNWPVSDQKYLFSLMENTCGVSLTPSSLMVPIKSVSGLVGIGPDVKFRGYSCSQCDAGFCIYRNKK